MFKFLQIANLKDFLFRASKRGPSRATSCCARMKADSLRVLKRASKMPQLLGLCEPK